AALHRGNRHAGAGMRMQHAGNIGAGPMDRAVNHISGFVDVVVGLRFPENLAVDMDFDQARGGDLLVEKAVKIEQHGVVFAGNTGGDVVIDEVGHAVDIDQAIAGGEF